MLSTGMQWRKDIKQLCKKYLVFLEALYGKCSAFSMVNVFGNSNKMYLFCMEYLFSFTRTFYPSGIGIRMKTTGIRPADFCAVLRTVLSGITSFG